MEWLQSFTSRWAYIVEAYSLCNHHADMNELYPCLPTLGTLPQVLRHRPGRQHELHGILQSLRGVHILAACGRLFEGNRVRSGSVCFRALKSLPSYSVLGSHFGWPIRMRLTLSF